MAVREPSISEVKAEVQSVLASQTFRQSRGLAKLLRYICGKALIEDANSITEYTIAVDVLGKPPEFKDTKDASARVEVHRLRKRLAEFYEQEGALHPVRIVIPTGQYVPHFVFAGPSVELLPPEPVAPLAPASEHREEAPPAPSPPSPPATSGWKSRRTLLTGAVLLAAITLAVVWALSPRSTALDAFWRPVLSAHDPILLCVGDQDGGKHPKSPDVPVSSLSLLDMHARPTELMLVSDGAALSKFAGLLQAKGKSYRVASQSETTFADLQSGPAVLIGLANNDWTERLVGKLRFTVDHRPPGRILLLDREHPDRDEWSIDFTSPYVSITRDYALVVRVVDPKTEQMVVTAGGISLFGTRAAVEFLTDPREFEKIERVAPRGWRNKNFEVVLATDVIRGKYGRPSIVATHFW